DASGNFIINAATDDVLVVSGIGFAKTEKAIGTGHVIEIGLLPVAENLNDVVVIGYGTQRKKNLTGSVVTLKNEDLVKRQVPSTSNLLQGLAP
ncbi:hypothetical protein ABTN75_19710, partial [Acinetobacter baumannii]